MGKENNLGLKVISPLTKLFVSCHHPTQHNTKNIPDSFTCNWCSFIFNHVNNLTTESAQFGNLIEVIYVARPLNTATFVYVSVTGYAADNV